MYGSQPFFTFRVDKEKHEIRLSRFSEYTSYTYQKLFIECTNQTDCPYNEFVKEGILMVFPELTKYNDIFDQINVYENMLLHHIFDETVWPDENGTEHFDTQSNDAVFRL